MYQILTFIHSFVLKIQSTMENILRNNNLFILIWIRTLFQGSQIYLDHLRGMVFNATFNIISVISWRPVLLVEESGLLGENHQPVASIDKLYHIMLYRVHLAWTGFERAMLFGMGYINYNSLENIMTDGRTIWSL